MHPDGFADAHVDLSRATVDASHHPAMVAPRDTALATEADPDTLTWKNIRAAVVKLASRHRHVTYTGVYGVPTGGAPVALMVANEMGLPMLEGPIAGALVVDDLVDTGRTLAPYFKQGVAAVDALYRKPWSPPEIAPHAELRAGWLRFPWERDQGEPVDAVVRLLQYLGEDPTRDGLLDTPRRVVKALRELTAGYHTDIASILTTTFDVAYDGLVVVSRIPFHSLCEHHMLPFTGHATVGYVPRDRVVGLSKLARLVDAYARRLQVQERMTTQIADALDQHLAPLAAGVIITANHTCMSMRGIQREAEMRTSSLRGTLDTDTDLRHEFLALHGD